MSRSVFQQFVDYLTAVPKLYSKIPGDIEPITVERKIMVALWCLGSLETTNEIADRFGIREVSVINCRSSVILSILKHKFIRWPNIQEMQIKINNHQMHAQRYFIGKHFNSLHLQAVCSHDMLFSHVFTGYPVSVHDSRVLIRPMGGWVTAV